MWNNIKKHLLTYISSFYRHPNVHVHKNSYKNSQYLLCIGQNVDLIFDNCLCEVVSRRR